MTDQLLAKNLAEKELTIRNTNPAVLEDALFRHALLNFLIFAINYCPTSIPFVDFHLPAEADYSAQLSLAIGLTCSNNYQILIDNFIPPSSPCVSEQMVRKRIRNYKAVEAIAPGAYVHAKIPPVKFANPYYERHFYPVNFLNRLLGSGTAGTNQFKNMFNLSLFYFPEMTIESSFAFYCGLAVDHYTATRLNQLFEQELCNDVDDVLRPLVKQWHNEFVRCKRLQETVALYHTPIPLRFSDTRNILRCLTCDAIPSTKRVPLIMSSEMAFNVLMDYYNLVALSMRSYDQKLISQLEEARRRVDLLPDQNIFRVAEQLGRQIPDAITIIANKHHSRNE